MLFRSDASDSVYPGLSTLVCGFCTPGLIMSAVAIAGEKKRYTRDELRRKISGHLCRCTGYENILNAVEKAIETNINMA